MSDLNRDRARARAEYIDDVVVTRKRFRNMKEWERRLSHARQVRAVKPTRAAQREVSHAKRMVELRTKTFRRSRAGREISKREYEQLKQITPREIAVNWASDQVGTREMTGNNDGPTVHRWQDDTARGAHYYDRAPYCGIGCENACRRAGVKTSPRWASVAFIEDDARRGVNGFRGWTTDPSRVRAGDLVVVYGRGVHVELVLSVKGNVVKTVGFNTSPGNSGSQSNGGGTYFRDRNLNIVHGFALVDFPG